MPLRLSFIPGLTLAALTTLFIAGCGDSEPDYVEVREVQESPEVDPHAGHDHAPGEHGQTSTPTTGSSDVGFAYTTPDGWTQQAPSSMKLLSFAIGSPPELISELSVSAFPGDVGGQLANINRWRRQVGLGPISPEAMEEFVSAVLVSGKAAWQVDFTGPAGTGQNGGAARVVATAVSHNGQTWFFKLMGNDSALEDEVGRYADFLKSVQF